MDFNQNYFQIFGLTETYDIDLGLLSDRFLELQKEVHPDRFVGRTDQEKRLAMQWATLVNSANEALKSPLRRAVYLLEQKGISLEENPQLSPAFLMEQIELREQLEDIEAGDGDLEALDTFKGEVRAVLKDIETRFSAAIENDVALAETLVYEMQFLQRLFVAAIQLEEKLLDY